MSFILDTRIKNDSVFVCDWPLSQVRLSNNAAFPWLILIPRIADTVEIIDLSIADQEQLLREMRAASHIVKNAFNPTKVNVANLGNVVAQLHVHVIARYNDDPAWPGPVWNSGVSSSYDADTLAERLAVIHQEITRYGIPS